MVTLSVKACWRYLRGDGCFRLGIAIQLLALSGRSVPIADAERKWKRPFDKNAEIGEAAIRYALVIFCSSVGSCAAITAKEGGEGQHSSVDLDTQLPQPPRHRRPRPQKRRLRVDSRLRTLQQGFVLRHRPS